MKDTPSPKSLHSSPTSWVGWLMSVTWEFVCCLGVWGYIDKYFSTQKEFLPWQHGARPFLLKGPRFLDRILADRVWEDSEDSFFLFGNDQLSETSWESEGPGTAMQLPGTPKKGTLAGAGHSQKTC